MSAAETFDDPHGGIHAGNLEVRLARGAAEIDAAQALRYSIFYEEMSARPSDEMRARKRDFDSHDEAEPEARLAEARTLAQQAARLLEGREVVDRRKGLQAVGEGAGIAGWKAPGG